MGEAAFVKEFDAGALAAQDYVLADCCRDATRGVLAYRHWHGDVSKVAVGQKFDATYGYDTDNDMPGFTRAVNTALDQLLKAHGRKNVALATGVGQVVDASSSVGDFISEIIAQAESQP